MSLSYNRIVEEQIKTSQKLEKNQEEQKLEQNLVHSVLNKFTVLIQGLKYICLCVYIIFLGCFKAFTFFFIVSHFLDGWDRKSVV